MHEIIFRGKCIDNGEWVYGDLLQDNSLKRCYISGVEYCTNKNKTQKLLRFDFVYEVISETVGQYTGLTDKNGSKIFEGDIVKTEYENPLINGTTTNLFVVIYNSNSLAFAVKKISGAIDNNMPLMFVCKDRLETIGNIFDNHEFIKEN